MPELRQVLSSLRPPRIPGILTSPKVLAAAASVAALTIYPSHAFCAPIDAPAAQESGKDAQASIQKRVTELMRTGVEAYRAGNLEEARVAFEDAWKLKPHAAIAGSLADVEMRLSRYRDAAVLWRYYIDKKPPDAAEANQQLSECMKHIGRLRVVVDVAGAALFLDGEPVGTAPAKDELLVDPGDHVVTARLDRQSSPDRKVSIGAGEQQNVEIEVPPSTHGAEQQAALRAPEDDRLTARNDAASGASAPTWALVTGTVLTVGAGALGIAYLLKANSAEDDASRLRAQTLRDSAPTLASRQAQCSAGAMPRPSACDALAGAVSDSVSARNVEIGAFVGAGIFGIATAAAFFLWPASDAPSSRTGITVAPYTAAHERGARFEVRF